MTLDKDQLIAMAFDAAEVQALDGNLVCALIHNESAFNPWSIRYEQGFYRHYIASMEGLSDTEKTMRATSFGLMQVMGEVAREFGFTGKYLSELCDPLVNLTFGCQKLARCMKQANRDTRRALLLYNGGGNLTYPDLVLQHVQRYSNRPLKA